MLRFIIHFCLNIGKTPWLDDIKNTNFSFAKFTFRNSYIFIIIALYLTNDSSLFHTTPTDHYTEFHRWAAPKAPRGQPAQPYFALHNHQSSLSDYSGKCPVFRLLKNIIFEYFAPILLCSWRLKHESSTILLQRFFLSLDCFFFPRNNLAVRSRWYKFEFFKDCYIYFSEFLIGYILGALWNFMLSIFFLYSCE